MFSLQHWGHLRINNAPPLDQAVRENDELRAPEEELRDAATCAVSPARGASLRSVRLTRHNSLRGASPTCELSDISAHSGLRGGNN